MKLENQCKCKIEEKERMLLQMFKVLLKLYGADVILSLGWLGKMLVKEKIRDKNGLPSVFNDLYDDYLKY